MKFNHQFVHVSFRREDFRIPVLKPLICLGAAALLLLEIAVAWSDELSEGMLILIHLGVALISCAAILLLISSRYHVEVGPEGVRVHSLWPRTRHLHWSEVSRTRLFHFLGFDCLVMKDPCRRKSLWVPLIVQRADLFLDMVENYLNIDESRLRS